MPLILGPKNKRLILTGSINLCVSENQQQRQHMEYMHLEAGSSCLEGNHKLATSRNSAIIKQGFVALCIYTVI